MAVIHLYPAMDHPHNGCDPPWSTCKKNWCSVLKYRRSGSGPVNSRAVVLILAYSPCLLCGVMSGVSINISNVYICVLNVTTCIPVVDHVHYWC